MPDSQAIDKPRQRLARIHSAQLQREPRFVVDRGREVAQSIGRGLNLGFPDPAPRLFLFDFATHCDTPLQAEQQKSKTTLTHLVRLCCWVRMNFEIDELESLTINEVSKILKIHRLTLNRYIKGGRLPFPVIKFGTRVLFPRREFERWYAASIAKSKAAMASNVVGNA